MSINSLIKLNGLEITEHNRKFSKTNGFENYDLELAAGNTKRFYKEVDGLFLFSWTYLPNRSDMTVDGRPGRDYLMSIVESGANVLLDIKESNDDEFVSYQCMITEYIETMVRNSLQTQCRYYDVSMGMESL